MGNNSNTPDWGNNGADWNSNQNQNNPNQGNPMPNQNWGAPQQAPQPSKKKKHIGLKIFLVVVVLIVIGGAPSTSKEGSSEVSSSSSSKTSSSSSSKTSSSSKSDAKGNKKELKVGDSFEESHMKMTVDNIEYDWKLPDSASEFEQPKDDFTYVKMDVTMANTGDNDEFASFSDFQLYADNNPYDQEYGLAEYGVNPNGSDFSSLSAGRKASFSVFWQVPVNSTSVEIEYAPSFWSNEKILIKVK